MSEIPELFRIGYSGLDNLENVGKSHSSKLDKSSDHEFSSLLESESKINLSQHASVRIKSREIPWTDGVQSRIQGAMNSLEKKGSREALILIDGVAVIANVKTRTVVTVMDAEQAKEKIFTNIDSTAIA